MSVFVIYRLGVDGEECLAGARQDVGVAACMRRRWLLDASVDSLRVVISRVDCLVEGGLEAVI